MGDNCYHIVAIFAFAIILPCTSLCQNITDQLDLSSESPVPPNNGHLPPVLTTPSGQLQGFTVVSFGLKRNFTAYRGIPYAKPPVGELRFKAPIAAGPWEDVLNATAPVVQCPQINILTSDNNMPTGQEDCLVLNVYVPEVASEEDGQPSQPLPVMVAIHGGGFEIGSSSWAMINPAKFMDQDIILVSINYRLGVLGFLSTSDAASPGNYGLKDQVLALQWVQNNINAFGGDPSNVIIFGVSAGGASVMHHVVSPVSSGLFGGAIAQSGSVLNPWAINKTPLKYAKRLANLLDCPINDTTELVNCMRKKEPHAILLGVHNMTNPAYLFQKIKFGPVVERNELGNTFLSEEPLVLLKEGRINKVPVILGLTTEEGIFFQKGWVSAVDKIGAHEYLDNALPEQLSAMLQVEEPDQLKLEMLQAIRAKYFQDSDPNHPETLKEAIVKVLSDFSICATITQTADLLSQINTSQPVYFYEFSHLGLRLTHSFFNIPLGNKSTHADDVVIQFAPYPESLSGSVNETVQLQLASDSKMAAIINSLWSSFAKNRIPKTTVDGEQIDWAPYDSQNRTYLQLDTQPEHKNGILCKDIDVWINNTLSL